MMPKLRVTTNDKGAPVFWRLPPRAKPVEIGVFEFMGIRETESNIYGNCAIEFVGREALKFMDTLRKASYS